MSTIILSLSAKSDKVTSQHEVLIRFFHGRINQRAKTNVFVQPEYWNDEKQEIKVPNPRIKTDEVKHLIDDLNKKNEALNKIKSLVTQSFNDCGGGKQDIAKDWLKSLINNYNFAAADTGTSATEQSFFDVFNYYIDNHKLADHRRRQFRVVWRTFKRFELFNGLNLTFDNINADVLSKFEKFLIKEHTLIDNKKYIKVVECVPETRTPKPRGKNTINDFMTKLRSFFIWAIDNDKTNNNPFKHYQVTECVYGTPYYITIDERNQLYQTDMSDDPTLARQRDIFVFQCLIGCRVSDLWNMTKSNLVNGAIEYIPRKTKEGRAITVRVPLNSIAQEIIERYKDYNGKTLFPYTSQQQYNRDIKTMFKRAKLNRIVTVINPTTREEEQRPICDIASSHLARRCFIGNLYKKVKDPNLIGKLSGHKEGSRAFTRYREIDEETSKELVTMLE